VEVRELVLLAGGDDELFGTWIMHTISVPSAGSTRLVLAVVE
jgi:hypothetical protein